MTARSTEKLDDACCQLENGQERRKVAGTPVACNRMHAPRAVEAMSLS
jgi:hypothetical protein